MHSWERAVFLETHIILCKVPLEFISLPSRYFLITGVYLLRENVLTAALTPTRRHRVFLSVPGDSPKAGNKMAANLQIVNRNLQELPDDVVDMHWVTQAFAEVSDFVSPSSWIDRAMESLGYGARLFNYRRHYINEIIKFKVSMLSNLSRSVEPDVGRGPVEEAWTNLGVDKISKNSRSLNSVTMQDNSSSNFLNRLIPQHALTDSIKSNMNILSSVPVGSSGIRLVSVKLGQSVPTGANSGAVGLGDDIIPTSFKSMQLQLGSNLDSLCSSTTTIQVERVGNLVKGASSSNSQLVKKVTCLTIHN